MGRYVEAVWPGNPSGSTRAERTSCRYRAYVPDRLTTSELSLPASVAADLAEVEQRIRALNADHPGLANLEPLARFLLRAEAVASSNIEGLTINVRRLARSEAVEREGLPVTDETARAVLGNVRALDEAISLAADPTRPVSVEDIRAIHSALLSGTQAEAWAGVVRDEQNWIGGRNPCAAAFVPPPANEVPGLLDDLAAYLTGDDHPALLQAALAHSQFETIHPFADGNGRTGRALIQLVLRRRGVATRVQPPVSLVLATRADAYVHALDGTRSDAPGTEGLLDWVELFLSATGRACADTEHFAGQLATWQQDARARLGKVRADSAALLLMDALPSLPVFSHHDGGRAHRPNLQIDQRCRGAAARCRGHPPGHAGPSEPGLRGGRVVRGLHRLRAHAGQPGCRHGHQPTPSARPPTTPPELARDTNP